MKRKENAGVAKAIKIAGGQYQLAAALGVRQPSVNYYLHTHCPAEKAVEIESITKVPREKIRPDIFKSQNKSKSETRKDSK